MTPRAFDVTPNATDRRCETCKGTGLVAASTAYTRPDPRDKRPAARSAAGRVGRQLPRSRLDGWRQTPCRTHPDNEPTRSGYRVSPPTSRSTPEPATRAPFVVETAGPIDHRRKWSAASDSS